MISIKNAVAAASLIVCGVVGAAPVYVGQWHVGDGPQWSAGVQNAYSGQQAAALLFGGNASDYLISTISDQVADINNMAWMDQYGFGIGALPHAESFSDGAQYTYGIHSAYILDNSCYNRYGNPTASCSDNYINYAFTNAGQNVPEPASLALLGLGLAGLAASRRRKV